MPAQTFKLTFFLSILCATVLFISCSNKSDLEKEHLVFRYNEHSNITSLDPAFARNPQNIWPTNQLFNGLVQLDDSLKIRPDVAYHWEIIDSLNIYRFFIRNDVYFHKNAIFGSDSTRTVRASDFVYSFDRLTDPNIASPGSWVLQNVNRYWAENEETFCIQLKQPFPAFLGLLSMRYCSVVPEEAFQDNEHNFRDHPVGTGPFQFKLWEENVKLVLRKNPLYFETDESGTPLPYLEAVSITFLPDKQSEFLQFAQGKLDFISGLDNSYKDEILTTKGELQPKYQPTVNLVSCPYLNTEYLGFFMGTNTPEIQSLALRQAVNYGFDRRKMITYLRNGMGIPAENGFIPMGLPGFDNIEGYTYDPDKAKDLVMQYKSETGDEFPEIVIGTNSQYLDLCEFIQRELEKIGIAVTVDVMPPSTLRQMKSAGELEVFRASWVADYPDAENYLSLFYSPNFTPNGPNYMHYKNEQLDSLYQQALSLTNIEERKLLYSKMDSLLISDAPVVPLFYDKAIRFVHKNVQGLGINPQNFLFLKRVRKLP